MSTLIQKICVCIFLLRAMAVTTFAAPDPQSHRELILVIGAAGEESYIEPFKEAETLFTKTAGQAAMSVTRIQQAVDGKTAHALLEGAISRLGTNNTSEAWIVLLGHGTFDGKSARFNLEGPDVSAEEMAGWLGNFKNPLVLINCAPSSAPFVKALSKPNRILVTATRSGQERNATRFGNHLAKAISNPASDRDKDGRISLLEAFLAASASVEEEYKSAGQLATEHAMIEDNADSNGTQATNFKGIRPVTSSSDLPADGTRAHQLFFLPGTSAEALPESLRKEQMELEAKVESLRKLKSGFSSESAYLDALEAVLLPLARITQTGSSQSR